MIFGPQNANAATTQPSGVSINRYGEKETWVRDASAPGANDGSVLDAAFFNRIIGALNYLVKHSGVSTYVGDATALFRAVAAVLAKDAPPDFDTFGKIAEAIGNDPDFALHVNEALDARVKYDGPQSLTPTEAKQAQANMRLAKVAGTGAFDDLAGTNVVARLDSPTFTGTPKAPTPLAGDNSTQISTTAFVQAALATAASAVMGQCRLVKVGSNVVLQPFRGNLLTVNGVPCVVPNVGVSLAPTGLTASTLYYVYAVAAGGVVTALEASTTGHVSSTTGANSGNEVKSGDETRTLVGMVYPTTGPAFVDTIQQRFVRSWHNSAVLQTYAAFTANRQTASNSFVVLGAEIKTEALIWKGETWSLSYAGTIRPVTSVASVDTGLAMDTTTGPSFVAGGTVSTLTALGISGVFAPLEGYHYAIVVGRAFNDTAEWSMSSSSTAALVGRIG